MTNIEYVRLIMNSDINIISDKCPSDYGLEENCDLSCRKCWELPCHAEMPNKLPETVATVHQLAVLSGICPSCGAVNVRIGYGAAVCTKCHVAFNLIKQVTE